MHIASFYDVGMVSPESFTMGTEFGHAIGGGARADIGVGAIRLDAAYNPGRKFASA